MKYKISQFANKNNVTYRTVWNWIKGGKLVTETTDTGRVRIIIEENQQLKVAVYARVSSSENKDNLERQKERLISYCNAKGYMVYKTVAEVGSGLNDERKKLESILLDKNINLIVVEHKERLARFGVNYLQKLLELYGRRIEIVNPQSNDEDDLMQDFVSIITSFTARLYGRRMDKRITKKLIKEISTN
jgi:predicted site-specific integrase-resolvase